MFLAVSFVFHLALLYSVVDLFHKGVYEVRTPAIPCNTTLANQSRRVFLILADDMNSTEYLNTSDVTNLSFLRKIMGRGTWGTLRLTTPVVNTDFGISRIASGTGYEGAELLNHFNISRTPLDSIFHYINSSIYIGPRRQIPWNATKYLYTNQYSPVSKTLGVLTDKLSELLQEKNLLIVNVAVKLDGYSRLESINTYLNITDEVMNKFYNDSKTTFIFTSITGEGGEAPFVAWGASITPHNIVHLEQNDIAGLISTLLGNPIPAQSNGIVPSRILDIPEEEGAKLMVCNQEQVTRLLIAERKKIKNSKLPFFFKSPDNKMIENLVKKQMFEFSSGDFMESAMTSQIIIQKSIEHLKQYRNYYRFAIKSVLVMAIVSYWFWLLLRILGSAFPARKETPVQSDTLDQKLSISSIWSNLTLTRRFRNWNYTFLSIFWDLLAASKISVVIALVYVQNWPMHYLVYLLLFDCISWRLFKNLTCFLLFFTHSFPYLGVLKWSAFTFFWLVLITLHILDAYCLMIGLLVVCVVPYMSLKKPSNLSVHAGWVVSCLALIVSVAFSKFDDAWVVIKLAVYGWTLFIAIFIYFNRSNKKSMIWTFAMIFPITIIAQSSAVNNEQNSPTFITIYRSFVLAIPFLPVLASQIGITRLFHVIFSIATPFLILTVGQESLALLILSIHLVLWYCIELLYQNCSLSGVNNFVDSKALFTSQDVRRSLLLLYYFWCTYYIAGNSDYPDHALSGISSLRNLNIPVYTHLTPSVFVFLIYKLMLPYVVVCSTFVMMYKSVNGNTGKAIEWFLLMNSIIGFGCFMALKEQEDYQKLGYALMRHFTSQLISIMITIIYPISEFLCTASFSMVNFQNFVTKKPGAA